MKSIVLIGFAAAGKTTVGQLLASSLGCSFVDCDQLLQQATGQSIEQMLGKGENYFRQQENLLLAALPTQNSVIACGGGSVLCSSFANFAKDCTVVWLQVDVATCMDRLGQAIRPLHDGKSPAQLQQMMAKRNTIYSKYANLVVDAKGTPTQVAQKISAQLGTKQGEQL